MTAPALRPLGSGELLDLAFRLYRRLFAPLVAIQIICSAVPFLIGIYVTARGSGATSTLLTFASYLLGFVLSSLAAAATAFVISESYLGRSLAPVAALERAAPRTGSVVVASLLVGLVAGACMLPVGIAFMAGTYSFAQRAVGAGLGLMALSLALLFLPATVFAALALATPALVLEENTTPIGALARSWALTSGFRLRIAGLFVLLALLVSIPIFGLMFVAAVVGGLTPGAAGSAGTAVELLVSIVGSVVGFVVTPVLYCFLTLLYYDLRVRKEGFDLQLLAASLEAA